MKKLIKDGRVAVLVSPGFGAGWSTWNTDLSEILFDPDVVQMVGDGTRPETIELYCEEKYPNHYFAGASDLTVVWVPVGTEFMINEYDGAESIIFKNQERWITA